MSGVVAGFTVIFVVIAVGYLLGRLGTLGSQGQFVLGRLVFFVATPALLFTTLASSDLSVIFSPTLAVASATAFAVGALYVVVAKIWLNRPLPELTIGALSASYVNSANLGIPIAVFVLGDATFVAPLLLFQIVVYSPDRLDDPRSDGPSRRGCEKLSLIDTVTAPPFKNPIVLAGAAGLIVALIGWVPPPRPLMQPFELIGATSVRCAVGIRALALRRAGAGEGLESTPRRRAGIDAQDRGPTCAGLSDGAFPPRHRRSSVVRHRGRLDVADGAERLHLCKPLSARNGPRPRQCLCHHFGVNSRNCAGHSATRLSRVTVDSCVY